MPDLLYNRPQAAVESVLHLGNERAALPSSLEKDRIRAILSQDYLSENNEIGLVPLLSPIISAVLPLRVLPIPSFSQFHPF